MASTINNMLFSIQAIFLRTLGVNKNIFSIKISLKNSLKYQDNNIFI